MKKDLKYETPKVEIVEVEVEQGFRLSDEADGNVPDMPWG